MCSSITLDSLNFTHFEVSQFKLYAFMKLFESVKKAHVKFVLKSSGKLLVEIMPQPGGPLHLADHEGHHRLGHQVEAGVWTAL